MSAAARLVADIEGRDFAERRGRVTRIAPTCIEATGPLARLGDYCEIDSAAGPSLLAEVVAVDTGRVILTPLAPSASIALGARVVASPEIAGFVVGDGLADRAIDALGRPIDNLGPIAGGRRAARDGTMLATLDRVTPHHPMATGIRAIDALLPIGVGQRVGIFAASGVGKTSLVEQLSRQILCDHVVICLVGERGREVEAIWSAHQGRTDGAAISVVAATSDESASMRVRAVEQALAMCEHWREAGRHVVLFVDSITRLALALRELGLAAGEPPALRALTPNVFAFMPRIVERCGAARDGGAISAIFTVLSETDDVDDPIVELMKSLLDGHIILSRRLAERGHFPAIDAVASVSRLAPRLLSSDTLAVTRRAQAMLAEYDEARMMIESGIYRPGNNAALDRAIEAMPALLAYLRQASDERADPAEAVVRLRGLVGSEILHG